MRGETRGTGVRPTSGNRVSPVKGKTPLVLPCEGRDAGDRGSPNLRGTGTGRPLLFSPVRVSPLARAPCAQPPGPSSLPRRERQRGSCLQGAVGRPLERDRKGLATRRRGLFCFPVFLLSCLFCFPGIGGPAGGRCSPSSRGLVNRWGNRRLPAPQDPSCSPL